MRISDWSSDVCSSDLVIARPAVAATARHRRRHDVGDIAIAGLIVRAAIAIGVDIAIGPRLAVRGARPDILGKGARPVAVITRRSEERRGGKECVSTCRSRWSPFHDKKKTQETTKNT